MESEDWERDEPHGCSEGKILANIHKEPKNNS